MIGLDSETHLIKPGLLAPRIVCFSWSDEPRLQLRVDGLVRLREVLLSQDVTIHNAPFDLACAAAEDPTLLPLIFDGYRKGAIHCSISRQKVIDVALGMRKFRRRARPDGALRITKTGYTLAEAVELYTGRHLEKEDTWRLRYALLDGVPLDQWPEDAKTYAINDAKEHLVVWEAQRDEMKEHWGGDLPNLAETAQSAWALHLMSCWGVRAEAEAVERFVGTCEEQIEIMRGHLVCDACKGKRVGCGVCGGKGGADPNAPAILKPDGTRTMAEIRRRVVESLERLKITVPRTDPSDRFPDGQVQTDKETLEKTDDPQLHALAEAMTYEKHLGQWGPVVKAGVERPVCARYNEMVETGRTSCSAGAGGDGTNFQNPPRKGDVRPCFTPRVGWCYVSTDADTIELRAHAQNCLELVGWSRMAEALVDQHANKGPDLHLRLAANIIGIDPYEAQARYLDGDLEVHEARQFSKCANFGYPGGLGARAMVAYAAGMLTKPQHRKWFGTSTEDQDSASKRIRDIWFATYPENREYFRVCAAMVDQESGEGAVRQLMSNRLRGGARFTSICNGFFQGRVADAMKEALFVLAEECYSSAARSVLYGSRPVMFLHDEPIVEHPHDETLTARAERQRQIVVAALNRWMPDIPCTSTAVAMRRWQKGAEPVYRDGHLVPSRPEKVGGKIKWVEDSQ